MTDLVTDQMLDLESFYFAEMFDEIFLKFGGLMVECDYEKCQLS